jgi:hypothetical protein
MKQPDRYQKIVKATFATPCRTKQEVSDRVVKLLRREHAAVVRMVRDVGRRQGEAYGLMDDQDAIDMILERLARRRQ